MQENTNFPKQRLSYNQKGKVWRERHLDWAENATFGNNSTVRKNLLNKKINFDLYGGKLHMSDMKLYLNPYNKITSYSPEKIQHFPIMNSALDILIGEEVNRKPKMIVKVINPESISQIEKDKAEMIHQKIMEYISADATPEEETQKADELLKYINYSYQDYREMEANEVLRDVIRNVDFYEKLKEGFKHVLICGEEIYLFDIVGGATVMEILNPKKVFTFRSGLSSCIEDSDIIVLDDYWSVGRVHDTFYDKFTKEQLSKLDEYSTTNGVGYSNGWLDETPGYIKLPSEILNEDITEGYLDVAATLGLPNGDYVDGDGNVRVLRVYWRSQRKILKLKRYDLETGEAIEEFVSESYIPNKTMGEEVTPYWVNEWWQGTKIGKDIYLDIKPKDIQYRRMSNPSYCHPGIVGQVYNTNQNKPLSMVDKMKPLQYQFNAVADRWLKIMANHVGNVAEIDLAKVAWDDIDKFLHYVRTENMMFLNSFKESNKGVASGVYNTVGGRSVNMDQTASIQLYANLMQTIRGMMLEMVGITPQRIGEISNRETVGGIERAVNQSSHMTAELFAIHDNVKKRAAEILLETQKHALKGNKKKLQYVTNGISASMEIDGDEFCERDYGLYVENDLDYAGLKQSIQQLAQAWSQNDTIKPSTILSMMEDVSIGSMIQKIRNDEQDKQKRDRENFAQQQQMMREQNEAAQAQIQANTQLQQQKMQLDDLMNQRDNSTKLQIKMLDLQVNSGEDNSLEIEKLQLQKDKLDREISLKQEQLDEQIRHNRKSEEISKLNKTSKNK